MKAAKLISITALHIICLAAYAQKLPNVQAVSMPAPAGIKVDGRPTEWSNGFQAFNHATGVYYTIANDTENLYLVVQGTDAHTAEKIISGGVTLTIKNPDKKSSAQPVALTFPFVLPKDRFPIVQKIKEKNEDKPFDQDELNKQLISAEKEIDVRGIKEIQDTIISVYNDAGIIAATRIDSKKVLTYELSIPLKYLQQNIDSKLSFNYNIRLNPPRVIAVTGAMITIVGVSSIRRSSAADSDLQDLLNATDFSGTYVLAK
jgi:hypothetical protein